MTNEKDKIDSVEFNTTNDGIQAMPLKKFWLIFYIIVVFFVLVFIGYFAFIRDVWELDNFHVLKSYKTKIESDISSDQILDAIKTYEEATLFIGNHKLKYKLSIDYYNQIKEAVEPLKETLCNNEKNAVMTWVAQAESCSTIDEIENYLVSFPALYVWKIDSGTQKLVSNAQLTLQEKKKSYENAIAELNVQLASLVQQIETTAIQKEIKDQNTKQAFLQSMQEFCDILNDIKNGINIGMTYATYKQKVHSLANSYDKIKKSEEITNVYLFLFKVKSHIAYQEQKSDMFENLVNVSNAIEIIDTYVKWLSIDYKIKIDDDEIKKFRELYSQDIRGCGVILFMADLVMEYSMDFISTNDVRSGVFNLLSSMQLQLPPSPSYLPESEHLINEWKKATIQSEENKQKAIRELEQKMLDLHFTHLSSAIKQFEFTLQMQNKK